MKTNSLDFDAQALKNKILDLAMRGKLVPQDPNDEPASVLLEKIKAEKKQLIKEKKIRKTKLLPPITEDEKPFNIPNSWEWVRLGNVLALERGSIRRGPFGSSLKKAYFVPKNKNTYKVYQQGNAIHHTIAYGNYYISRKKYNELKSFAVKPQDIIISGAGTIGKTYILPSNTPKGVINQALIRIRLNKKLISNQYFLLAFQQKVVMLNKKAKGTAMKNMFSIRNMENDIIWPLPPLNEQSRIAAKVAQLFDLVRKVESSIQQYAKLQTLLKSKILDLAMRGKLVKQDPNDEPASVLLEKIKTEKEKLIKEKKIKKPKPLSPITDDEKPFTIPESWEWVRLGDIGNYIQRGRSPKYTRENTKHPIISQKCVQWNSISLKDAKFLTDQFFNKLENYRFVKINDILWNSTGTGTVGRVNIVKENFDHIPVDSHVTLIRINQNANPNFIYYYLMSPVIQKNINDYLTGTTKQKELGLNSIRKVIVSVPPLNEQDRIVTKIEQLFTLLRKVESSI